MVTEEHNWRLLAEELGVRGRVSGSELTARCPLHDDRTPSFSMNVHTGKWICFSSCGSGNFYKLVAAVLGCSMTSAMDWTWEHRDVDFVTTVEETAKVRTWLWRQQYEAASTNELPKWWLDRGFDWTDATRWGVRWDHARQQLLIPVAYMGELVGTIARNLKRGPKYVNSPLLPRSQILFGLAQPVPEAIVVVEGALDCIWLWKHGVPSAALLGLSLGDSQMRLLHGCSEVTLAMDNDEPGIAAQREIAAKWARYREPRQLTMVSYPHGRKDVQECTSAELVAMVSQRRIAI